ncbi:hypothetical protein ACFY9A_29490 [Streptomyces rubradiris]|uniref:hypothetical protein n=1 Tax=Streptomyces rubradiris TaxID=285531 RepID=UPI0036DFB11E
MDTHRSDSDRPRPGPEPRLKVGAPAVAPARRSLARRLLPRAVAAATALCALVVLVQGHAALPFERIVTIRAKMASKADFFEDPEVRRLLVRHGYRVHLTRMGSRGIATQRYDGYDIVFPSGQPAADLITSRRAAEGHPATTYRPFVSPIVLGTYREYAETLREAGIATPLPGVPAGARPMYYSLDMRKFLGASAAGRRWDDLGTDRRGRPVGIGRHGIHNGNKVLDETYVSAEGKSISPIAVIYEHQFLTHQIATRSATGDVDTERVLLHPSARFVTEPQLIALTPRGDALGELITGDPALQRRTMELGGGPTAHLRVVPRGDGLLTPDKELPEGQFQAHCLGKATSWDPDAREVVLQYPVAVFR